MNKHKSSVVRKISEVELGKMLPEKMPCFPLFPPEFHCLACPQQCIFQFQLLGCLLLTKVVSNKERKKNIVAKFEAHNFKCTKYVKVIFFTHDVPQVQCSSKCCMMN